MHVPALGQRLDLTVLGEDHVVGQAGGVLHGPPHEAVVLDAVAVVGEEADAEAGQLGHGCELLTRPADGEGGRRVDGAERIPAESLDLADDGRAVDGRRGVGHRHHGSEAAARRGPGAGFDGLGLLPARFSEVGVEVDQAGADDAAAGVQLPIAAQALAHGHDHPVTDGDVGPAGPGGVDHRPTAEDQVSHPRPPA